MCSAEVGGTATSTTILNVAALSDESAQIQVGRPDGLVQDCQDATPACALYLNSEIGSLRVSTDATSEHNLGQGESATNLLLLMEWGWQIIRSIGQEQLQINK